MIWTVLSILFFGVFDYFGYNLMKDKALGAYRVIQVIVQVVIALCLWKAVGLGPSLGFIIIWWTGGADAVYYAMAEATNGFGWGWAGRGVTKALLKDGADWFGWTPIGILRGGHKRERIPPDSLIAELLVGLIIGLIISVTL